MSTTPPPNGVRKNTRQLYLAIALGCGLFVVLTFIAMLTYAGGSVEDHSADRYSLTHNFLSNLGMLTALSGRSNWISAVLFFLALSTAGTSLVIFFILFQRLFHSRLNQHALAQIGSTIGVLAGICFTGIAFTPADVARAAHVQFVIWAFRLFPLAVLFYIPVLFMEKRYPKGYVWVFTVFSLMLVGYYLLLTNGPSFDSPNGLVIQVVGQKVISYASIFSIGIQAVGAYRFLERST